MNDDTLLINRMAGRDAVCSLVMDMNGSIGVRTNCSSVKGKVKKIDGRGIQTNL